MAEDAEHGSLGRGPSARAPLLSIHNVKNFVVRWRDSCAALRALGGAPRVLRVNQLPLPFSAPPRSSA